MLSESIPPRLLVRSAGRKPVGVEIEVRRDSADKPLQIEGWLKRAAHKYLTER